MQINGIKKILIKKSMPDARNKKPRTREITKGGACGADGNQTLCRFTESDEKATLGHLAGYIEQLELTHPPFLTVKRFAMRTSKPGTVMPNGLVRE